MSFLGVKQPRLGVDRPPHLVPRLKKRRVILVPLLPLGGFKACYRVNFTFSDMNIILL
jgi:hypothetical protein